MSNQPFTRWRGRGVVALAIAGVATVLTASAAPADEPSTGPVTTLTATPASPSSAATATFRFTSPTGTSFRCALDDAVFRACTSPTTFSGLGTGQHTFRVAARAGASGAFGPATTYRWEVDRRAPTVTIDAPTNTRPYTAATWATLCGGAGGVCGSAGDRSGVDSVTVAIADSVGRYWNGTAFGPTTARWLAATGTVDWSFALPRPLDGSYTVYARAKDLLGNETTEATATRRTFRVDTTPPPPPTFTSTPEDPTTSTTARFTISAPPDNGSGDDSEDGDVRLRCSVDGGAYRSCDRTVTLTRLAVANHCLAVTATDRWGNTSAPATYCWEVIVDLGFGISGLVIGDLAPGVTRPVQLTITNPYPFPLQVLKLTTAIDAATTHTGGGQNPDCAAAENFAVGRQAVIDGDPANPTARRLVVAPNRSTTFTITDFDAALPTVTMIDDPDRNQDACKGTTIHLHFTGTARKAPTP